MKEVVNCMCIQCWPCSSRVRYGLVSPDYLELRLRHHGGLFTEDAPRGLGVIWRGCRGYG